MTNRRQMLNRERVTLVDHDPHWSELFARERLRLLEQPYLDRSHVAHIGSTAVQGLCAKPTIDIMIGVRSPRQLADTLASLRLAGYEYLPEYELDIPERMFCIRRGVDGSRAYHASLVLTEGQFWRSHLVFRNRLREDLVLRGQYCHLKRKLAKQFEFDRAGYVAGKTRFITDELCRSMSAVDIGRGGWAEDFDNIPATLSRSISVQAMSHLIESHAPR